MGDSEDDDEEPLVIVADPDPNQPMEEQLWGEDGLQAVDGDGKDGGEAGMGSAAAGPVIDSQFKVYYVEKATTRQVESACWRSLEYAAG
ncbi:hypothetical protein Bca52824_051597 [Brassica carinata]|uniref:Uncharacterized protein n=1 Tax=Brassica carinata TaxID=52824 RepID=A0A8X7R2S7_BRACI|nr:hypothetical protein Bca52824_051597 [Brassica carinata]